MNSIAWAVAAVAALGAAAATAQSTNAPPVIKITQTPADAKTLPWINDEVRAYADTLAKDFAAGANAGYVLAAAPTGNWGSRISLPTAPQASVADIARQALETCEYFYTAPCRIIAINGMATRLPDGGWSEQPAMLRGGGGRFDRAEVPFVPEQDRAALRGYGPSPAPKALAMTTEGYWSYSNAASEGEAIAEAIKNCEGEPKARTCFVYAVNDWVVADLLK
jgi:hypothetical protein